MASDSTCAYSTFFLLYSISTRWWGRILNDGRVAQSVKHLDRMSESDLLHAYRVLERVAGRQFKTLLQGAVRLEASYKSSESQVWATFASALSADHEWKVCVHAPSLSVFHNSPSGRRPRPARNGIIATSVHAYYANIQSVSYIRGHFSSSGLRAFRPDPNGLLYAHRGRGPQWTDKAQLPIAPDMSCTTDCIIMALIFLDVGSTQADYINLRSIIDVNASSTSTISSSRRFTAPETYMFQAIATDWLLEGRCSETKALFQRAMLRSRGEREGASTTFLELSPQMGTCFTDVIGQLLIEYTVACQCRRCNASFRIASDEFFRTTMICPTEIKFWAQQLQEWCQTISPYHPPMTCRCGASGDEIDTQVQHVRVPPRICVSPVWIANPYAAVEYFQFDGITFEIHTRDEGICRATYRFIGGIFGLASHFRVFWLDTPVNVRERRWKSYDGIAPQGLEGVILGDIRADDEYCPVPYQYVREPGALFFECVSLVKSS